MALIISELVTNAVLHGSEPIRVALHWDGACLRIEVSDGDSRTDQVRPRPRAGRDQSGHGLHIVSAVAQQWGVRRTEHGKTAWAEVAVDETAGTAIP